MNAKKWLAALAATVVLAFSGGGAAYAQTPTSVVINGTTYTECGVENGNCTWTGGGKRSVAFGDAPPDDPVFQYTLSATTVSSGGGCFIGGINWANGNNDPAPGYGKVCWSASGGGSTPAPTVTVTANPASITKGSASTVAWTSTNATSCSGIASGTSGSKSEKPTTTTTYTETCTGAGGTGSGSATVTVTTSTPAPTATLSASPTSINKGASSTLTLTSTNATSCTGPISGTSGTLVVSPASTTTYTETCSGVTSPPATATATVTVNAGTPAPTATLTASPSTITSGGKSTLTLASTNATSCVGPVSGTSGTAVVTPTSTTTYSETCSGATSPPATATATVTVSAGSTGMNLTANTTSGGNPPTSGNISADTPDPLTLRVFGNGAQFSIAVSVNAGSSDTVIWSIQNQLGTVVSQGSFPVPNGVSNTTLSGSSTISGYFAFTATLQSNGGALPSRGTQPAGYIAFGVLPPQLVPVVTYTNKGQHRFGMQGFNDQIYALNDLGVTDTIDDREQSWGEPNGPNTYTPSINDLDPFYASNPSITRLVRLDGIPAWNSPTGQFSDSYNLPSNTTEYGQYMAKVGTDTAEIHNQYYPADSDYYQVTWEPSLGWPQTGGSSANGQTPAQFTQLYQIVYNALHSTDPNAVVMGPTEPFPNNGSTASGNRLQASPGMCAYIDGVTTHGYYNAPTVPANPPELQDGMDPADAANALDNEIIALRGIMQTCKPNMKLFSTELGISYDVGVSYAAATANQLYAQAAVAVRSHIIILGQGAQRTYYFFGPDFPDSLSGYGSFFDLNDAQGAFGATNLAPKPEAMGFAALSRVLDGTVTLGPLNLPTCVQANGCVHAYAFQQLNNGTVIQALWYHKDANWPNGSNSYSQTSGTTYTLTVDSSGASGNVQVIDMMGNSVTTPYTNGQLTLTLTESPIYVVGGNASVVSQNATVPLGYTGQ